MNRVDLSMSTLKANLLAPAVAFPLGGLLSAAFALVWGVGRLIDAFQVAMLERTGVSVAVLVVGIVSHELLHGIGWTLASARGWNVVSFGFQLKTLTPYAHLEEPVTARVHRVGLLMPAGVLGVLPWMVGMLVGDGLFNLFGVLFIMLASGDLMAIWLLRRVRPDQQVQDHPERVGVYLLIDDGV